MRRHNETIVSDITINLTPQSSEEEYKSGKRNENNKVVKSTVMVTVIFSDLLES